MRHFRLFQYAPLDCVPKDTLYHAQLRPDRETLGQPRLLLCCCDICVHKHTFGFSLKFCNVNCEQAYFTADSALSLSVEPADGVLTPFGTDGTPLTVTYSPMRYAPNQKGRLIVETEDIRCPGVMGERRRGGREHVLTCFWKLASSGQNPD